MSSSSVTTSRMTHVQSFSLGTDKRDSGYVKSLSEIRGSLGETETNKTQLFNH